MGSTTAIHYLLKFIYLQSNLTILLILFPESV